MKWQKNTGVMPCEGNTYVEYCYDEGGVTFLAKAYNLSWSLDDGMPVTHWCIAERVPFDYVEPKVWRLRGARCKVGGPISHEIECNDGEIITVSNAKMGRAGAIIKALNAWEERNGTK